MPRTDSDHGRFGGSKIQNEPQPANSVSSPVLDREGSRLLAISGKLIELCCGALNYYRAFCWIQPT